MTVSITARGPFYILHLTYMADKEMNSGSRTGTFSVRCSHGVCTCVCVCACVRARTSHRRTLCFEIKISCFRGADVTLRKGGTCPHPPQREGPAGDNPSFSALLQWRHHE